MAAFDRIATVTASTKRVGAVVSGLVPDPTVSIASLKCMPLMPLTPELAQEYGFAFKEVLQTFVTGGLDIIEGDILVIATVEYPIKMIADWPWRGTVRQHLFVDQIK